MRPLILKTARMLTDCMDAKFGLVRFDENRVEYKLLDAILTDDMARAALKMSVRRPTTPEELARKLRWSVEKTQAVLDEMAQIGIVEYNRHNADRHKQYVLPIFVVGSAENLMLNKELVKKLGMLAPQFFYEMSLEPLKLIAGMVPPGVWRGDRDPVYRKWAPGTETGQQRRASEISGRIAMFGVDYSTAL